MKLYRVENLNSGDIQNLIAPNIKAAHEHGCKLWPGQPVEVTSSEEHMLRELLRLPLNQMADYADTIYHSLCESTDLEALLKTLDQIEGRAMYIRQHVKAVQAEREKSS